MVTSKAASVKEYLAELPDDRRPAIEAVRDGDPPAPARRATKKSCSTG